MRRDIMATAQRAMTSEGPGYGVNEEAITGRDAAESILKRVDESTKGATGVSLFHILTFGSIGASIALYLAGNRQAGIFVGLWPPTFQALKAVVDKNAKQS
jgi:hypothetical protein